MGNDGIFETARAWIDTNSGEIFDLSDQIWEYAEPSFCEMKSAQALCDLGMRLGIAVTVAALADDLDAFSECDRLIEGFAPD